MGLPLYRAPVESDVKTKVPKDPPTRARSTIRRTARRAVNDPASTPSARFYHRRHGRDPSDEQRQWERMQLPNVASLPFTTTRVPPHQPPRTGLRRATTLHDTTAGAQDAPGPPPLPTDPALRDAILRNGRREIAAQNDRHQQEMARYFGEHMAMLHAATSARPLADTPSEGDETEPIRDRWASASRDRPTPPRQNSSPWAFTRPPPGQGLAPPGTSVDAPSASSREASTRASGAVLESRPSGQLVPMRRMRATVRAARAPTTLRDTSQPRSQAQSPVDGLGDRNRSLSPEDEGVWDTLLSSITPDPQPPSVGNSFASTAPASAATSQTTESSAHSSHTDITGPATIEALDFDFEPPCESGGDNSDTEGEDDDLAQHELRRFGRTYADVTRSQREEDDLEIMGGVESMQRIVRNLAAREDIPDEWWAEAGLSRSLQTRREAA